MCVHRTSVHLPSGMPLGEAGVRDSAKATACVPRSSSSVLRYPRVHFTPPDLPRPLGVTCRAGLALEHLPSLHSTYKVSRVPPESLDGARTRIGRRSNSALLHASKRTTRLSKSHRRRGIAIENPRAQEPRQDRHQQREQRQLQPRPYQLLKPHSVTAEVSSLHRPAQRRQSVLPIPDPSLTDLTPPPCSAHESLAKMQPGYRQYPQQQVPQRTPHSAGPRRGGIGM